MRHSTQILHSFIFLLIFSSVGAAQNHAGQEMPSNTEASPNFPFEQFTISNNRILTIFEDRSQNLWIGTYKGFNKFDRHSETFTRYVQGPEESHGWRAHLVMAIHEDRAGNLWIGYWATNYLPLGGLYKLEGMIWLPNGVLSRFDPGTASFTHFRFSPNQNDWGSNYHPFTTLEDDTGNLWVGTRGCGVFKIDLKPQRFTHYQHAPENPNSLSDNDIRLMVEDSKGSLWIATRDHGLSRLDPQTGRFTNFKHDTHDARSLSNDVISAICEDHSGNVWIGTKKGLNRFDASQQNFTRYEHDPTNPHSLKNFAINTIFADHGDTIWIGMAGDGGFCKLDRQAATFCHYNPNPVNNAQYGDNNILRFFEDRKDNLWIETNGPLYFFDRRTGQCRYVKAGKPGIGRIRRLLEDQYGRIWGWHGGLYKVDVNNLSYMRYRLLEPTGYPPTIGSQPGFDGYYNRIQSIYLDVKGNIWCGADYGLYKFDPVQEQVTAHYYAKDGLPSNFIGKITVDNAGRLWLLTGAGVSIFDENAPSGAQFTNLGPDDGVINSPSAPEAFIRTRSGEICWGGTNGIYRFYPEVQSTNPHPPQIRLTDFKKFNKPVKLDSSISTTHALLLDHDENFFSLSFSALDFTNPKQNQYAYKLEGFDKDWIQAGKKHEASYTNVPPGKYTFWMKGSNDDGVWNETGASVQIIITPPFWQTWWFRLVAALAAIGFLAALYNYRVSKLLEIERTRLRIARDLHDDVGSSLSSIALTAEMLQKELATNGLVNRQLARVNETAKKLSHNLKEIVWAIDPHRDKFDDLLLHIKETAEELLGQKGITYTFDLPSEELPQSLKMEFRRNLFLIYKEMLHNVVKHAEATKVEIALTRSNGMLQLQVVDNGKGFVAARVGNGNGMKSMQTRAGELNGQLEIESEPEQGTRVRLSVKIT